MDVWSPPKQKSQFEKSYNSEGNLYLAPPTFQNIIIIISRNNISQHARRNFNLEHLHVDDRMVEFWHQHLVSNAYFAIGKQPLFLIGSNEKAEHLYWSLKTQRTSFQPIKIQS